MDNLAVSGQKLTNSAVEIAFAFACKVLQSQCYLHQILQVYHVIMLRQLSQRLLLLAKGRISDEVCIYAGCCCSFNLR